MNRFVLVLMCAAAAPVVAAPTVLEAEAALAPGAEVFHDERASGKKAAGVLLGKRKRPVVAAAADCPAGDYVATFWLEAAPAEVLHHLAVGLTAGDASVTLGQVHFGSGGGYAPFELRFLHRGGRLELAVSGVGGSGFDGMRRAVSETEKAGRPEMRATPEQLATELDKGEGLDELIELEEGRSVAQLKPFEHRLLCDRIELRPLRLSPALVARVEVDKVHYLPGETVKATARVAGGRSGGAYTLVAEDVTEVAAARTVFTKKLQLGSEEQAVEFEFPVGEREFGHELRCSLRAGGAVRHARSEVFGVSRNVYRVGICGPGGPQDMRNYTAARAAEQMERARRLYANYFERFAWAPCDYSNLAPQTEVFFSGQTQYPGSISGFKNLIGAAHKVGVKAITYGKACAAGIDGFKTFQRHPDFFGHRPEGPACEAMSVFYLERMLANDYNLHAPPSQGGWQHWASLWCNWSNPRTVEFGAQAIVDSIEMLGWDGVRWDGHFVGAQKRFLEILKDKHPNFVHGYNISFARPGSALFMPPDTTDFHEVARDHGLLMDESVRDWSHSNFSSGATRPFYEAMCREADYEKRIGGLPLFITFDMASKQDLTFGVLCGLAAGERYTYITSPGDFAFGPLPKFLTRYSAFVWDDTRRVARPDSAIAVAVGKGPKGAAPWWRESVWLRKAADGRQQLLINLLNPPGYTAFSSRVQPPPTDLRDVALTVATPAGATLERAVHVSPDLTEGHAPLQAVQEGKGSRVVLPRLHTWSIVVLEYSGAPEPAFPLTTPIEDAAAEFKRRAAAKAAKAAQAKPKPPAPPPPHRDYARVVNADAETAGKMKRPAELRIARNGVVDVHHARGAFSWVNPLEAAIALFEAGRYTPSWVDLVGFKLGAKGCMDEFPDSWEQLLDYDVVALDDVHSFHLGPRRRVMIADFVRSGGGLLVFGGYFNLSLGADHNTALAELLPVRIRQYRDIACEPKGLRLAAAKAAFFDGVDWAAPGSAFTVDTSPLKEGAQVLATAGGKPAIVAHTVGKGRVVVVLVNPCGDHPPEVKPYWEWSQWPKVLAACVRWLAEGAETTEPRRQKTRTVDRTKITPTQLVLEGVDLDSAAFTKKLEEAQANVVDAESARMLMEATVEYAGKIESPEVLAAAVECARPFFDKSLAGLGEKLSKSEQDFLRQAGYQILGMAADRKHRAILEKGLTEQRSELVRAALIGLGGLADPASAPAVRALLAKGEEELLVHAVLVRLGRRDILPQALAAYARGLARRVHLKCGRGAAIDTLWGGVSFKLTRAQRKRAMAEYRKVLRLEAEAKHDVEYFNDTIRRLAPAELGPVMDFFAATETREVVPLAFALINRLPAGEAKACRARMKDAKLEELRLLAAE